MSDNKMYSSYTILKEQNLILELIKGILRIENIKKHKEKVYADENFSSSYNSLLDLREANIDFTLDEFKEYADYLASKNNAFIPRNSAILVSNANQIAYTHAFKLFEGKIPLEIAIFRKLDDAVNWLNKNENSNEIQSHFLEMDNKPLFQWKNSVNSFTPF